MLVKGLVGIPMFSPENLFFATKKNSVKQEKSALPKKKTQTKKN